MKAVLDANVFVSAVIQNGPPHRIVQDWLAGGERFDVDSGDDYLVALAREKDVEVIVSGDKDLLEWAAQQPPVVTPADFERRLSTTG